MLIEEVRKFLSAGGAPSFFFFFFFDLLIKFYVWSFHDLTEYYYCILITWVLIYSYIRPSLIIYFQIKAKKEK